MESALFAGMAEEDLKEWDVLARVRYVSENADRFSRGLHCKLSSEMMQNINLCTFLQQPSDGLPSWRAHGSGVGQESRRPDRQ